MAQITALAVTLSEVTGLRIVKELHTTTPFEVWVEYTGAIVPAIVMPSQFQQAI